MSTYEAPAPRALRDYLQTLIGHKLVVLATAAVAVTVSLVLSYSQEPQYAAVAKLLLSSRPTQQLFTSDNNINPASLVETEIEVITTEPVMKLVQEKIGSAPPVRVSQVGFTNVIMIRANDTSPSRAAEIANAYADSYVEYRRTQALNDLVAGSVQLQDRITDIQKQLDDLQAQLDAAPTCPANQPNCPQRASVEQSVSAKRTTLVNTQALYRQRLDQAQVDKALTSGGAERLSQAAASNVPFAPTPKRSAFVAGIVGLMLGVGLALLIDHLDDSIKTKEDMGRAAPGLPVIAMIPVYGGWKSKDEPRLASIVEPSSPTAESYRTLRTAVQFLGVDRPVRTIQVTSPNASEGKTTTLANLGVALARAGASVVIVCADLRRPRVHEFFGLSNAVGLTSVLLGEVPLSKAVQRVPGVDRLYLLPSGPLPPNPSELLQSRRTADILSTLHSENNFLLIDSPPILPVTDGLLLSKRVDGTLVVVSAGKTSRKELDRTIELLGQVEAPVLGGVLNGVSDDAQYGYSYGEYKATTPSLNGRSTSSSSSASSSSSSNGSSNGAKRRGKTARR